MFISRAGEPEPEAVKPSIFSRARAGVGSTKILLPPAPVLVIANSNKNFLSELEIKQ